MKQRFFLRHKENFRQAEAATLAELQKLFPELQLQKLAIYEVYDLFAPKEQDFSKFKEILLTDPVQMELIPEAELQNIAAPHFAVESIVGQFNQRAHVAEESLLLLTGEQNARVKTATLYVFQANSQEETLLHALKGYLINPVAQKEKDLNSLELEEESEPEPLRDYSGFLELDETGLKNFLREEGLAMALADLQMIQAEFKKYGRAPSEVEIKVLDTYWSDHCRHSTFNTQLTEIENNSQLFAEEIAHDLARYQELRQENGRSAGYPSLMELATIVARDRRRRGLMERQEVSDEINACSIHAEVENAGKQEPWLLMFKNETHNHPTEIEPFGGAGTCLGGGIRDPLSGRAKVYQAMRLTGAGDIAAPLKETRAHKLPQYYLSTEAAKGYSDYANQIGVTGTTVRELHHPGYVAKRMELGALVAAAPEANVTRANPQPGDVVLLLGAATGRDGIGGATGSSRAQDRDSAQRSGAEVQKGNPPAEQGIMHLFCRPEIAPLIRKCNDFGAGGVSVAVGELADSLDIQLEKVTTKYPGLNAMELAISESQERMAVLVAKKDAPRLIEAAAEEDVEATEIAQVTDSGYLRMTYHGETVFEIARDFIDTDGARKQQKVEIRDLEKPRALEKKPLKDLDKASILAHLSEPNHGLQAGLAAQFDSTIGRSTVLLPYGGKTGLAEEMISLQMLPVKGGSRSISGMTYGYSLKLADYSPYLMGAYSVVEALAKLTAAGLDYRSAFLSNQEFFRSLGEDPTRWGEVSQALLGLMQAQEAFEIASIGGKDSMSGSFEDLDVPPTLFSFAVTTGEIDKVLSIALPREDFKLIYLPHQPQAKGLPDYAGLKANFLALQNLNSQGQVLAASTIRPGGLAETLAKMCVGNMVGIKLAPAAAQLDFFQTPLGGLVLAVKSEADLSALEELNFVELGYSALTSESLLLREDLSLSLAEVVEALTSYNAKVYPLNQSPAAELPDFAQSFKHLPLPDADHAGSAQKTTPLKAAAKVKVLIPHFPGSNGSEDVAAAFQAVGAETRILKLRRLSPELAAEDRQSFISALEESDILAISGSYGLGNQPGGAALYIAQYLRQPAIYQALKDFVARDCLILGLNNGFQALVKADILPYGFTEESKKSQLSFAPNPTGKHLSTIARTRIVKSSAPWFSESEVGEVYYQAFSASEGTLILPAAEAEKLFAQGQVLAQYVDAEGQATLQRPDNPAGSAYAIEALVSPCGHILGKMTQSERFAPGLWQNIAGQKALPLFARAVAYRAERS